MGEAPKQQVDSAGRVLMGTCGWSDASLVRCGRFYPVKGVRTAEDKLRVYSQTFPCVEVDSSCYAIPRPAVTAKWAASVPPGFRFHFKAFSIFCRQRVALECFPVELRPQLPPRLQQAGSRIGLQDLPAPLQSSLWRTWHEALEPVIKAGVMGCVLFQFQVSFAPCASNHAVLRALRSSLDPRLQMAVEFRNRGWFVEEGQRVPTCRLMTELGAALVGSDDLQHEMFQKDREQQGLPPGARRIILPIAMEVTQPAFGYMRVHRRHGTTDRILPPDEIQAWAARLQQYCTATGDGPLPSLNGPCYLLWGTDWEDAPVVNARALDKALGPRFSYNWKAVAQSRPRPGSILALLGAKPKAMASTPQQQQRQQRDSGAHLGAAVSTLQQQRQQRQHSGVHLGAAAAPEGSPMQVAAAATAAADAGGGGSKGPGEERAAVRLGGPSGAADYGQAGAARAAASTAAAEGNADAGAGPPAPVAARAEEAAAATAAAPAPGLAVAGDGGAAAAAVAAAMASTSGGGGSGGGGGGSDLPPSRAALSAAAVGPARRRSSSSPSTSTAAAAAAGTAREAMPPGGVTLGSTKQQQQQRQARTPPPSWAAPPPAGPLGGGRGAGLGLVGDPGCACCLPGMQGGHVMAAAASLAAGWGRPAGAGGMGISGMGISGMGIGSMGGGMGGGVMGDESQAWGPGLEELDLGGSMGPL